MKFSYDMEQKEAIFFCKNKYMSLIYLPSDWLKIFKMKRNTNEIFLVYIF